MISSENNREGGSYGINRLRQFDRRPVYCRSMTRRVSCTGVCGMFCVGGTGFINALPRPSHEHFKITTSPQTNCFRNPKAQNRYVLGTVFKKCIDGAWETSRELIYFTMLLWDCDLIMFRTIKSTSLLTNVTQRTRNIDYWF